MGNSLFAQGAQVGSGSIVSFMGLAQDDEDEQVGDCNESCWRKSCHETSQRLALVVAVGSVTHGCCSTQSRRRDCDDGYVCICIYIYIYGLRVVAE